MKHKKIISLITIFSMILTFVSITSVNAKDSDFTNDYYTQIFGITSSVVLDNAGESNEVEMVEISTTKEVFYDEAKKDKVVFEIYQVNGKNLGTPKKISYGNPKKVKFALVNGRMKIKARTTKKITVKNADETDEKTTVVEVQLTIDGESEGTPIIVEEDVGEVVKSPTITKDEIDCNKYQWKGKGYYDLTSFEEKFCWTRNNAKNAGNYFNGEIKNKTFSMKCSKDAKKINLKYSDNMSDQEKEAYDKEYYQNQQFYYTYKKTTLNNLGQYSYNYYPGADVKGDKLTCTVKCQEAVIVEYGPPVAQLAGLCFQYKVKVTSRTSCNMEKEPAQPKKGKYCIPNPTCYHNGITYKQGGPNSDYDACVKNCDGGKYTSSCSKKCYESVYGQSINSRKVQNTALGQNKVSCAQTSIDGGCYYRNSKNGAIYWYGLTRSEATAAQRSTGEWYANDYAAPGRWYREYKKLHKDYRNGAGGYNVFRRDGFYRANYGSNGYCHDSCVWSGCASDQYINPGYAKEDYEANKKIYEEAVKKCEAKATCSETSTYFTFEADYNKPKAASNGKVTYDKVTVHFPYTSTQSDDGKLLGGSAKDNLTSCKNPTHNNTSTKNNSTILKYAGCYAETCSVANLYMTEWSFPGAWVNKKTGEISFVNTNNTSAWRTVPDKFCIPRDAGPTNHLWYYWYYSKIEGVKSSSEIYQKYYDVCISKENKETVNANKAPDPEEWNIRAKTTKFGYFKWNFNIECFYATDDGSSENSSSSKKEDELSCKLNDYRVRTVSNAELFPSASGAETSTGVTGTRETGYNWTETAKLKTGVVPDTYVSNPETIKQEIIANGDKIYNDSTYTDYEIELTPAVIKRIRDYNQSISAKGEKKESYGVFCGRIYDVTGGKASISIYESNLFNNVTDNTNIAACAGAQSAFVQLKTKNAKLGCNSRYGFCDK